MAGQGITITINAETAQAAAKMGQFFAGLNANLGKLGGMGSMFQELATKLAAVFTVGALVRFGKQAIDTAEQVEKLSQKTGLAVTTISAFQEAARKLGTPFESLTISLGMFSDKVYTAVRQGGNALLTFRELGIRLLDAGGALRSTDDLLKDVAERFKELPGGPQKAAAAMDLFGRSGRELIPILNQGAEGIERMRRTGGGITPEMARSALEFNMGLREVLVVIEHIFRRIAADILPALKRWVDGVRELVEASEDLRYGWDLVAATFAMEFSKALAGGIMSAATFFGEAFIRASGAIAKALDAGLTGAINGVINWLNKSPQLARLLGGSIQPVSLSDVGAQVEAEVLAMQQGGQILRKSVDEFFNKGIAASRALLEGAKATRDHLKAAIELAVQVPGKIFGLIFGGGGAGGGAGEKAPVSEEARKLMEEVNRQWAAATQSKIALLDLEEKELKEKIDREVLDVTVAEEQKAKVVELYAAKRKEILTKEEDAKKEIALAAIQGRRTLMDRDPYLTENQKREKLLELLREENRLIEENITLNRRRVADLTLSDETRLQAQRQLQELELRQAETQQQISTTAAQGTFQGEFRRVLTDLGNEWGSWAAQAANAFKSVFHSAVSSITDAITGLIMRTKTWGEALRQIGSSIVTELVRQIVQMGITFVLTHIIMRGAMLATAALARVLHMEKVANDLEAFTTGSLAGVGTSGEQGGWIGVLIYLAVLAAAIAAVMSMTKGFASGGWTGPGSGNEVVGVVHPREVVFSAPAVERAGGPGPLLDLHQSLLKGGMTAASSGLPARVVIVSDERKLKDLEGDAAFENLIVRINERNRWRYQA